MRVFWSVEKGYYVMQALESLHGAAVAVWHLQRVLAKKRDPLSHVLFSDSLQVASCPSPLSHFWYVLRTRYSMQ